MQTLRENTILQGGKYTIISILGQGGFGITYLGVQSGLDRKVAIKEFFIREMCERDDSTTTLHWVLRVVEKRLICTDRSF